MYVTRHMTILFFGSDTLRNIAGAHETDCGPQHGDDPLLGRIYASGQHRLTGDFAPIIRLDLIVLLHVFAWDTAAPAASLRGPQHGDDLLLGRGLVEPRARSHRPFVLPLTLFMPDPLR